MSIVTPAEPVAVTLALSVTFASSVGVADKVTLTAEIGCVVVILPEASRLKAPPVLVVPTDTLPVLLMNVPSVEVVLVMSPPVLPAVTTIALPVD